MNIRKHILCAAMLCAALLPLAAGDWYVCLGSFRVAANAQNLSVLLNERGLPNAVARHGDGPDTLYRVVYERPFADRDEARIFKNGLLGDSRVRALGISGLWICEAEIDEPQEALGQSAQTPEKIDDKQDTTEILQKNDGEQVSVSDEKPFSLKVRSYKEEHPAVQNSERLRENDIDAYVVKTYDDDEYFSFDVHAGAFATPEESADTEAALAALGINDATLSDYGEIKDKIRRYDEVVQQDDVVFETADNATMPEFSAAVRTCLADLPVNKNFLIESIIIVDFDTLAEALEVMTSSSRSQRQTGFTRCQKPSTLTTCSESAWKSPLPNVSRSPKWVRAMANKQTSRFLAAMCFPRTSSPTEIYARLRA